MTRAPPPLGPPSVLESQLAERTTTRPADALSPTACAGGRGDALTHEHRTRRNPLSQQVHPEPGALRRSIQPADSQSAVMDLASGRERRKKTWRAWGVGRCEFP